MLGEGQLEGTCHNIHQVGSMSEQPLSPTTSSSPVRTMRFLIANRFAESSAQPTSGTSSPFNFISGDVFPSPALDKLDSKHDDDSQTPSTSITPFIPSSRRSSREILAEDPSMSRVQAGDQQLYQVSSFPSGGVETDNTQSSGTSAGNSQLSSAGGHGTVIRGSDEFFENSQHHTATSADKDHRNTANCGSEPPNDATVDWGGSQQAPPLMTQQLTAQQPPEEGRNEKTLEAGRQEPSSLGHDHQLGSAQLQPTFLPKEEGQNSQLNMQQVSEHRGSSSESVRSHSGDATIITPSNLFPDYSTSLMPSDSYNFPTEAELLGLPTQSQDTNNLSRGSVPNAVQEDGRPYGNVGELFPDQNLSARLRYSSSSLKGNWTSIGSHVQYATSSLLDSNVHSSLQIIPPLTGTPVSTLLSDSSLQDNSYRPGEPQTRDGTSYFSPPQMQTHREATMQLCLNPTFGGPGGDLDASASGLNLVLMSNAGVDQLNMHSSHNQQHFLDIPLPSTALAHSVLAQRTHLLTHQGIAPAVPGPHIVNNQDYSNWRSGGNELLFLPGRHGDSTVHTQPFSGQLSAQLQQAELAISQYGSRRSPPLSSVNQVTLEHSLFQNGDGHSTTGIANCQFQGLSLSLSSQQPSSLQVHPNHGRTEADIDPFTDFMSQASAEAKGKRVQEIYTESRYNGILSRFRPQRDDHDRQMAISAAAQRLQNYDNPEDGKQRQFVVASRGAPLVSGSNGNGPYGCKYLNPSQVLLGEICIITKSEERTANRDHLRFARHSTWSADDQHSNRSASNNFVSFDTSRDILGADSGRKDFMMNVAALPGSSSSVFTEPQGREPVFETHGHQENREALESRKLKLATYLEQVDRRYRSYCEEMLKVINGFNSIAGPGAATPYTTLALQAMSRHFRCLRDAVSSQLRAVKRSLGEQDTSPTYSGRSRDLSSLRFADQQLRQQRALQQLGMLQQHAWRPQRGLPERAVSVLRSWLFEHFLHPYPKDSDKMFLAKQTGLTRSQVSNWFINARVRLWKPMVEEMYLEEFSNSDEGGSGHGERNPARERRRENESPMGYGDATFGSRFSNGHPDHETGLDKQERILTIASEGDIRDRMFPRSNVRSAHTHGTGSTINETTTSNLDFDDDQRCTGMFKKARSGIHNSDLLASPIASMEIDSDSPGNFEDPCRVGGGYGSSADQNYNEHQNSEHEDVLPASNASRYGVYLESSLTAYPSTGFVSRATTSTNGVSLTLGLMHSDGLSLSGAPQQKYSNQGHHSSQRPKDPFGTGVQDNSDGNINNARAHSELQLSHLISVKMD